MAPPADGQAKPARVRLRMYRIGFGDCFLLTFEYAAALSDGRSERHILLDFGSTSRPRGQRDLVPIARLINRHTGGGELDVVVVSHRHKDHLSAFADSDVTDLIAKQGFPKLVVRSWTEHPDAPRASTGGAGIRGLSHAIGDRSAHFLETLDRAEEFADALASKTPASSTRSLVGLLHHAASNQLRNADAVKKLRAWGEAGSAAFVHYGTPSGIENVVPGISVKVLGPPTVDQHARVATQRSRDKDEFWMVYRRLLDDLSPADFGLDDHPGSEPDADDEGVPAPPPTPMDAAAIDAPIATTGFGDPGPVRWLTDRMGRQRINSLLRIVRILDNVLNNTSVILLIDVPGAKPMRLLFPGDAQIENWEYALKFAADKKANLDLLRRVDLYKVGHHGSRNATPRTLYNLWMETATRDHEMFAVMSTKSGVHGESAATAVPRKTLVAALDTRMTLLSTQSLSSKQPWFELEADCSATTGLVKVAGP